MVHRCGIFRTGLAEPMEVNDEAPSSMKGGFVAGSDVLGPARQYSLGNSKVVA